MQKKKKNKQKPTLKPALNLSKNVTLFLNPSLSFTNKWKIIGNRFY